MEEKIKNQPESRITKWEAVLGHNLRSMRTAAELTQDDLSEKTGLSKSLISQLETGDKAWTLTSMDVLGDFFAVNPATFFIGAENSRLLKALNFLEREKEREASISERLGLNSPNKANEKRGQKNIKSANE